MPWLKKPLCLQSCQLLCSAPILECLFQATKWGDKKHKLVSCWHTFVPVIVHVTDDMWAKRVVAFDLPRIWWTRGQRHKSRRAVSPGCMAIAGNWPYFVFGQYFLPLWQRESILHGIPAEFYLSIGPKEVIYFDTPQNKKRPGKEENDKLHSSSPQFRSRPDTKRRVFL